MSLFGGTAFLAWIYLQLFFMGFTVITSNSLN